MFWSNQYVLIEAMKIINMQSDYKYDSAEFFFHLRNPVINTKQEFMHIICEKNR